jgi:hypothetical protein
MPHLTGYLLLIAQRTHPLCSRLPNLMRILSTLLDLLVVQVLLLHARRAHFGPSAAFLEGSTGARCASTAGEWAPSALMLQVQSCFTIQVQSCLYGPTPSAIMLHHTSAIMLVWTHSKYNHASPRSIQVLTAVAVAFYIWIPTPRLSHFWPPSRASVDAQPTTAQALS